MRRTLLAVLLAFSCASSQGQSPPRFTIRVSLWTLWHDREVTIMPLSGAMIRQCETCPARPLARIALQARDAIINWTEQNRQYHSSSVQLTGSYSLVAHGETLTPAYPLRITVQRGTLILAATLPVERYVELVVAAESGTGDSAESRKALSVVARSFALQTSHGHAGFDVCDSTHCQWVHWRTTHEAHAATLATAGESLWFRGSRAEAFFHQNCGGRMAAAAEVWPGRDAAGRTTSEYLVSRPDNYCQRAGSSEWSTTLSRTELTQALATSGLVAPGWKKIAITRRGDSGRAMNLLIGSKEILAESFRLAVGRALGWSRIRSNWFEVAAQGDVFLFHGRGSGHGVGLCQAGAAQMAREGRAYREILAQYFPGTTDAEETTGAPWQTISGQGFTLVTNSAKDAVYVPGIERAFNEAESRSGLKPRAGVTIRAFRSTPAFRDATLAPGWVAAFTEGDLIAIQPLQLLAARKLLASALRHEFLHVLVEEQAAAQTPLWLREGLVETWSADAPQRRRPVLTPELVDKKLAHAESEAESQSAHVAAGWYVAQLLDRFGRIQVLEWLRTGVPQSALTALVR